LPIVFVGSHLIGNRADADRWRLHYAELGYEGTIIRLDDQYRRDTRPKTIIKRKDFYDAEYPVHKIFEGKGNWAGMAKAVSFKIPGKDFPENELPEAGLKGTMQNQKKLWDERHLYEDGKSEVTVRYPNLTPDGKPRFGIGHAFYIGGRKY